VRRIEAAGLDERPALRRHARSPATAIRGTATSDGGPSGSATGLPAPLAGAAGWRYAGSYGGHPRRRLGPPWLRQRRL